MTAPAQSVIVRSCDIDINWLCLALRPLLLSPAEYAPDWARLPLDVRPVLVGLWGAAPEPEVLS